MRARVLVVLAAAAVAAGIVAGAGSGRSGPVSISVDATHPGRSIPRPFLGLSIEYQSVPEYMGSRDAPNRAFAGLAAALSAAENAPIGLRIGGNSGDQSWWNPSRRPRPPGVDRDLGPAWARSLATGRSELRAPLALGLNLGLDDPANALELVRAVEHSGLRSPGITALEVGNEPDLYTRARSFHVGTVLVRRERRRTRYSPAAYARQASAFARTLTRSLRDGPLLTGGGFATRAWARAAIPRLLVADPGGIGELAAHAYAITECHPRGDRAELRSSLLGDDHLRELVSDVQPYAGHGLPVRVSELNSAVCGGARGVSDTFASALWAPEALFAMAAAGVRQVDVHTWSRAVYAPFAFRRSRAGEVATVRPLYYGLLLFAEAAPAGSRLLPVAVDDGGNDVRAWATASADDTLRLLAINRSAGSSREIRLRLGRRSGVARLQILRSPGLAARTEVTLGGRGFSRPTATGRLPAPATIAVPVRRGRARMTLPAASAALLEVRNAR